MMLESLTITSPVFYVVTAGVVTLLAICAAYVFTVYKQRQLASVRTEDAAKQQQGNEVDKWPTNEGAGDTQKDSTDHTERDPLEFCEHIPSEVKRVQQRLTLQKLEEEMTEEQRDHEREVQREQLEAIFKLMQDQEDKFGISSMDDIQQQMGLYTQ